MRYGLEQAFELFDFNQIWPIPYSVGYAFWLILALKLGFKDSQKSVEQGSVTRKEFFFSYTWLLVHANFLSLCPNLPTEHIRRVLVFENLAVKIYCEGK